MLLAGAIAVAGLALAAKPGTGGGGSGGGGGGKTRTPAISVSPTSLAFGELTVGSMSAAQTVTVTNSGRADLALSSFATSSTVFAYTENCPATLAPAATCTVSVTFTPAAIGTATGTLTIFSNATNTPNPTVGLSGTGKSAPVATVRRVEGAGDSIMRGYNASCTANDTLGILLCAAFGDQNENSFLDGSSSTVVSLVDRYKQVDPLFTGGKAASASGSEMVDEAKNNFAAQAQAIVAAAAQPVRVFVELGGNDLCNRATPADLYAVETWELAVRTGLTTLVDGLPSGSTVLMVSVPRVQDLRQVGIDKQRAESRVDCESFWANFDVCRIATAGDGDVPARLAAVESRQVAYNDKLVELAAEYNAAATATGVEVVTDYDPAENASLGSYRFQPSDINGGDCFHPSLQGQNKLSEIIWNKNPYK